MKSNLYEQYATAYRAKREAEKQLDLLKPRLIAYVGRHDEPVRLSYGTFSIADVATYSYSARVTKLEAQIADLKAKERADGSAKKATVPSLRFLAK
jgi:hypothetical protein